MKRHVLIIAILFISDPFILPFFTRSRINLEYQDINIKTGQTRVMQYIWFLKIREKIKDTCLSRALDGEEINISELKPWHRVNAFSIPIGSVSPHYIFHSAFYQIEQIEQVFDMLNADQFRRKEIAKKVLTLWQEKGNDSGADKYISELMGEAIDRKFRTNHYRPDKKLSDKAA